MKVSSGDVEYLRWLADGFMKDAVSRVGMVGLAHEPLFEVAVLLNVAADTLDRTLPSDKAIKAMEAVE